MVVGGEGKWLLGKKIKTEGVGEKIKKKGKGERGLKKRFKNASLRVN